MTTCIIETIPIWGAFSAGILLSTFIWIFVIFAGKGKNSNEEMIYLLRVSMILNFIFFLAIFAKLVIP